LQGKEESFIDLLATKKIQAMPLPVDLSTTAQESQGVIEKARIERLMIRPKEPS